ncbi:hypothetical protein R3P38DRAFT_3230804 [Favolaschia claudopus]|uniref:Uncharacterized protein n=1 Tax=Favolaschia claudopus TaxID=2862362 RepID=A0AAV9ZLN0_9AGAR
MPHRSMILPYARAAIAEEKLKALASNSFHLPCAEEGTGPTVCPLPSTSDPLHHCLPNSLLPMRAPSPPRTSTLLPMEDSTHFLESYADSGSLDVREEHLLSPIPRTPAVSRVRSPHFLRTLRDKVDGGIDADYYPLLVPSAARCKQQYVLWILRLNRSSLGVKIVQYHPPLSAFPPSAGSHISNKGATAFEDVSLPLTIHRSSQRAAVGMESTEVVQARNKEDLESQIHNDGAAPAWILRPFTGDARQLPATECHNAALLLLRFAPEPRELPSFIIKATTIHPRFTWTAGPETTVAHPTGFDLAGGHDHGAALLPIGYTPCRWTDFSASFILFLDYEG